MRSDAALLSRVCLGLLAALVAASMPLGAQSASSFTPPRTPWGDPDLQGTWNGNDLQGIPMERAESLGTRDTLNDEELAQRVARRDSLIESDNADFDLADSESFESFGAVGGPVSPPPHWLERSQNISRQASYVIDPPDGRLPAPTPAALTHQEMERAERQERRERLGNVEAHSYTDRSDYDRCISFGPLRSLTPKIYNSGNRIVQGPGWVAFTNEMIHETRVIPTDGRDNVGQGFEGWMGNSVGRWEGDTLVVVTRNLRPEVGIQNVPLSDEGRLVERFRLVDEDTLEYRLTVEDPVYWTEPWTMMMRFPRDDDYEVYEYACHEGNYTMFNILSGSRAAEAEAASSSGGQ